MNKNKQTSSAAAQTQAATQQPTTNRSAQPVATFEVRNGTIGRIESIGLVLILTQPVNGRADALEIIAAAGKANKDQYVHGDIEVAKVQKVYSDKGSARKEFPDLAKDDEESVLNMARRLAGVEVPPQRQSQQREQYSPRLVSRLGRDDAEMSSVKDLSNGNVYVDTELDTSDPENAKPLAPNLQFVATKTVSKTDDNGNPIKGQYVILGRWVLVTK